jgi:single-stranded-DNA-specific exonuclease
MTAPHATAVQWRVAPSASLDVIAALQRDLGAPLPVAAVLAQRGYDDAQRARAFLKPSLDGLGNPETLPGVPDAVAVIADHAARGHPIMVHGDYDVDGQCAAALLSRVLRAAGATVVPFVPHRTRDGYDFGPAGVAAAAAAGVRLVVTCDCGITATEPVAAARARGIDVVVTDHHRVPDQVPEAVAVVNPRLAGTPTEAEGLCGAGVAWKLAQALVPALQLPSAFAWHLLDYVALATIADLVPLVGENRALVRSGLRLLGDSRWAGLRALVEASGRGGRALDAGQVGYIIAPRLNAVGRIGDAKDGLRLLLTDDPAEASTLAGELETLNARRQDLDQRILGEAVDEIEGSPEHRDAWGLVLASERWHPGVIGIVASRLVERYSRPAVLVAWDGDTGRGSGRSIPGLDLYGALKDSSQQLERFGGHRMAAGLSVRRDAFSDFRRDFLRTLEAQLTPDDLVPRQRVDLEVTLDALEHRIVDWISHLEPCGVGNPAPVFGVRSARLDRVRTVGRGHLRFVVTDDTGRLEGIAFGWADRVPDDWLEHPLDVAFRLERNEWRGRVALQARVVSLGVAE